MHRVAFIDGGGWKVQPDGGVPWKEIIGRLEDVLDEEWGEE